MDIGKLKNSSLTDIGRAADMLWLSFGSPVTVTTRKGTKVVSEYALHVQCPWRFLMDGALILGAQDIYDAYNPAYDSDPDWNWDEQQEDIRRQSAFQANAMKMKESLLPLTVKDVSLSSRGDIRIEFDKKVIFELFITGTKRCEYWRLIDFNHDSHIVVFDE